MDRMRVCWALATALCLCGPRPVAGAAVGVSIREETFDKFKNAYLPDALKELQNRRFPEVRTNWNGIDFHLWEITLVYFRVDVPGVRLAFADGQICIHAPLFEAYLTMRYEAKWWVISTDGRATFKSKGSTFRQCVRPKVAPGGRYDLESALTEANVNDFDINIDGGFIGKILGFFTDILKPKIRDEINGALRFALTDFVNGDLRKLVQSVPTEIMVDDCTKTIVDYSPASVPGLNRGIFYETNAFFFGPETRGKLPPFPLPGPMPLPADDFPVVLVFHEFVFQDFLWSFFSRNPLDLHIRDQKDFPVRLTVETFSLFFENLDKRFSPFNSVVVRIRTADFPRFAISGDALRADFPFNVTLSVDVFGTLMDFSYLDVTVSTEMVPTLLNPRRFEVRVKTVGASKWQWRQVGEFRVREQNIFELVNAVVAAFIALGDPTIPIPITGFPDEIKLSRTSFLIEANTLKLRTDVSFKTPQDVQEAVLL